MPSNSDLKRELTAQMKKELLSKDKIFPEENKSTTASKRNQVLLGVLGASVLLASGSLGFIAGQRSQHSSINNSREYTTDPVDERVLLRGAAVETLEAVPNEEQVSDESTVYDVASNEESMIQKEQVWFPVAEEEPKMQEQVWFPPNTRDDDDDDDETMMDTSYRNLLNNGYKMEKEPTAMEEQAFRDALPVSMDQMYVQVPVPEEPLMDTQPYEAYREYEAQMMAAAQEQVLQEQEQVLQEQEQVLQEQVLQEQEQVLQEPFFDAMSYPTQDEVAYNSMESTMVTEEQEQEQEQTEVTENVATTRMYSKHVFARAAAADMDPVGAFNADEEYTAVSQA